MKIAALKTAIALAKAKTHTIAEASAITGLAPKQLYNLEKRENIKFLRQSDRQNRAVMTAKYHAAKASLNAIFTSLK